MAIPDFQSIMLPLLKFVAGQPQTTLRDVIEAMAKEFKLTDEERRSMLPSGQQATFDNRVGWARTYLVKAGLLEAPRRGVVRISERGRQVLQAPPDQISIAYLARFQEFLSFRNLESPEKDLAPGAAAGSGQSSLVPPGVAKPEATPQELMESAYQSLRGNLADELLHAILEASPAFFEQLVVDLLLRMGYGGTRRDAGRAIGKAHDGGIDGIIQEDRLGLDVIYIQAKRWSPERTVGRPDVQQFVGALQEHRARKGVFITTSRFSPEARDYVVRVDSKIALIDGQRLAQLMIDFGLGVSAVTSYEIKRIDSDYFEG